MYLRYLILLVLWGVAAEAGPRWGSPWGEPPSPAELRHGRARGLLPLDEDSLHRYDVLKIEPHLSINFTTFAVSGYAVLDLVADEVELGQVDLRLASALTVDSVWAEGNYAAASTENGIDSLQILLTPALVVGDTVRVGVAYHGIPPQVDNWGGFHWAGAGGFRPQVAWTMGQGLALEPPPANYNWLPTYADPTDKLLFEGWFRVPQERAVSSVGLRIDTVNHGDGTETWHYRLDQPVSTYLIAVAASNYVIQTQRESGPLIENYVYPTRVSQAEVHFSNVPAVLDGFAELFGPYPFPRMGFTMTPNGDMEHVTSVFHVDGVVNANHIYDWLLFHEMAHMWWGNWVTCGDWRDLWLNEGFATYGEALSMEILYGHDAYMEYVVGDLYSAGLTADDSYSIYDPDYYWGQTVYEKGACVMHMLRALVGDSLFFTALREYGQEHAYGNAVTTEWQAALEEEYGQSLDWFFQPWVYGTRHPHYRVTLEYSDIVMLRVEQAQPWETLFTMPLEVRFYSGTDSLDLTFWTEAVREQVFGPLDLQGLGRVDRMRVDPNEKIMNTAVTYVINVPADDAEPGLPREFAVTAVYPNPFNATATVNFDLPQAAPVTLRVHDLTGREAAVLRLGTLPAGSHRTTWDAREFASGVYLFKLETPQSSRIAKAVLLK